jgi:AAA+ superfamily predicted ATPase
MRYKSRPAKRESHKRDKKEEEEEFKLPYREEMRSIVRDVVTMDVKTSFTVVIIIG